jgi:hypothetical protein
MAYSTSWNEISVIAIKKWIMNTTKNFLYSGTTVIEIF